METMNHFWTSPHYHPLATTLDLPNRILKMIDHFNPALDRFMLYSIQFMHSIAIRIALMNFCSNNTAIGLVNQSDDEFDGSLDFLQYLSQHEKRYVERSS